MDDDAGITQVLGLESAFGYHIERAPRPPDIPMARERPPTPWYPCLDAMGIYSGCLGLECPLQLCWTGTPTVSYLAALRRRFHPSDDEYAPGACCPCCLHVEDTTVPVVDQQRGLASLPLLHCTEGRWTHPISAAALVRRRIPAREDTDPAYCPRFAPRDTPRPEMEAFRQRRNARTRALRNGDEDGEAHHEDTETEGTV